MLSSRQLEPILPYPSRQSVMDLFLATIERSIVADSLGNWDEGEPLFLQGNDAESTAAFQENFQVAINNAEPSPWLLRDLKEFEQTLVTGMIEDLEATQEGRDFLANLRSIAVSRARASSNQEQDTDDAE
ncbi:MAG: hypothetical protein OXG80_02490 [Chloroflexi bacterium]|nr:hypothetical protein [Chloroflexota bacterium]